jgi:hypothetical protein
MDIKGFYSIKDKTIYIRIGEHLKKLLPVLFHEMTHAFLHQQNIVLVDNWTKKASGFDFESMMSEASQEEGMCELVSSLLCYEIFDCDQYPSKVDEYWLGWRLNVQAFIVFAKMLSKQMSTFGTKDIVKFAFNAIVEHVKKTNNLYKFVGLVPKDVYHRAYGLCSDLE